MEPQGRVDFDFFPVTFTELRDRPDLDLAAGVRFRLMHFRGARVGRGWSAESWGKAFHQVHFACHGNAHLRWGGRILRLEPGHAYFMPARAVVARGCDDFYEHYFLTFRCEWRDGIDLLADWRTPTLLGRWTPQAYIDRWQKTPMPLQEYLRIEGLVYNLFANSSIPLGEILEHNRVGHSAFLRTFEMLNRNLDARLRVSDLAAAEKLTPNSFSRLFRQHFATHPKDYMNRRLSQEACRRLFSTDLTVREVAESLGFEDQYYFIRFFSKMNRISPARYRQQFQLRNE